MSVRDCSTCRVSVDEIIDDACYECSEDACNWQPSYAALFKRLKEAEAIMFSVHKISGLTDRDDICQIMRPYSTSYPVALIKEVTYLEGTTT